MIRHNDTSTSSATIMLVGVTFFNHFINTPIAYCTLTNKTPWHTFLMTNIDSRNSGDCMSETTRSSFTLLPLINKAITDSKRHNYEVITENNRFSLSTFHACFTRVPPQITTAPIIPSLPVPPHPHSINTHTHTYACTTCEYTRRYTSTKKKNTHADLCKRLFMRVCSLPRTQSSHALPELVLISKQVVSWQHTRQSPSM